MFSRSVVFSVLALCSFSLSPSSDCQQFRSAHAISSPFRVFAIYGTADFNGDGRPDLVVFGSDPVLHIDEMAVMLQNADGTFTTKAAPSVPAGTTIVAELNGDGKPDLATIVPSPTNDHADPLGPATVTVSYGNGDGTFNTQPAINLADSQLQPWLLAEDLNHDGKTDLVAVVVDQYGDAIIQSLLNSGNGTFTVGPAQGGFIDGKPLVAGDFNGDGFGDLVINNDFQTEILLGNGDGSFRAGPTISTLNPVAAAVGDFNLDHKQDLVVIINGGAAIMLGKGDGAFQIVYQLNSSFQMLSYPTGYHTTVTGNDVFVGDLNHDGLPDVAISTSSSSQAVEVYYGKGNGTFGNPKVFNISASAGNFNGVVAFADFNHDGRIDVAMQGGPVGLVVANGSNDGGFNAPVIAQSANSGSIVKADFNGDGIEDIAVVDEQVCLSCTHTGTMVQVFLGTGKGYFAPPRSYTIPVDWGAIAVGDVNRDGKPDLVIARNAELINGGIAAHYSTPDLTVMLGRGDGTFQNPVSYTLLGAPVAGTFSPRAFLVDVNHDGKLDLVGDWGTALGNGTGQFSAPIPLPANVTGIVDLAPGYFDGSGTVELAVASDTYSSLTSLTTPAYVYVLKSDGTGHFNVVSQHSTGILNNLITADLNGDGLDDILYSFTTRQGSTSYTNLGVDLSRGQGGFSTSTAFSAPASYVSSDLVAGDYNRDGNMDVAILGVFDNAGDVAVLLGTGGGSLSNKAQYYLGAMGKGVELKVNADTAPDIVGTITIGPARLLNTGH